MANTIINGGASPYPKHVGPAAICSFSDGAQDAPLKSLAFTIEPNQSGSGDPSPSNIRPISGWSQVDGYDDPVYGGTIHWNQVGKNDNAPTSRNGLTITREADGYTVSGTANASPNVSASGWFGFATASTSGYVGHKLFASHKLVSGTISNPAELYIALNATSVTADRLYPGDEKIITYSSAQNSYFICSNGNIFTNAKLRLQVFDLTAMFGAGNEPATVAAFKALFPKDYYAYNAGTDTCVSAVNGGPYTPITIALGQTVYGGTVDAIAGKCYARPYYASYSGQTLVGPWISSHDKYVAGGTPTTGAQVVDLGGTETTIDLTPVSVNSLLGQNNVWCNTGDTELDYYPAAASVVAVMNRSSKVYTSIPLGKIRYDTYQTTPNQALDLDSYRAETGVLIRNVLSHTATKIEFNTPSMTNLQWEEVWNIIKAGFNNSTERKLKLKYYDQMSATYKTGWFYVPDVNFTIRNIDEANGIINYDEVRVAFIEY